MTQLRASAIARRRAEEERADASFRLRATTMSADSKRDARAAQMKGRLSCAWVGLLEDRSQPLVRHMGVDLRRGE
jgi:hypothetical protein